MHKLDRYISDHKPIYLFLSHFHLEHVIGVHTLDKLKSGQEMHIFGQPGSKTILESLIRKPFTLPLEKQLAKIEIHELNEGRHSVPFPVICRSLLHADPCYGYRVELEGKAVAFCTDTGFCDNAISLAKKADILIHECSFRSGEGSSAWPHTSPEEAAEVARKAEVKQLVLFHFDAARYTSIGARKEAEKAARAIFANTAAAVDDMELTL
ncbi:MAG: ribonuclease Z [Chloroflexi bacterium]|nr:ribonuclease Z [Chloroflexota bacterium]